MPPRWATTRIPDFVQNGEFYRSRSAQQQANLVSNLAGDLGQVKDERIKYTMLSCFQKADPAYGQALGLRRP
jgi:catalase